MTDPAGVTVDAGAFAKQLLQAHASTDTEAGLSQLLGWVSEHFKCTAIQLSVLRGDGSADVVAAAGDRGRRRWGRSRGDAAESRSWQVADTAGVAVGELAIRPPDALASWDKPTLARWEELLTHLGRITEAALLQDRLVVQRRATELAREETRIAQVGFATAFAESVVGMATMSLDPGSPGRLLSVNDALCRLTGRTAAELHELTFFDLSHPDDVRLGRSALRRAMAGRRTPFRERRRYVHPDGEVTWTQVTVSPLFDDDDKALYAILQVEDLRSRKEFEEELQARQDPLTNLLNRDAVEESMTDVLDRARRLGTTGAVLVCSLGSPDEISDPQRLAVAETLSQTLRSGDVIGRIAQNQFVIVAEEVRPEHLENLAGRIRQALDETEQKTPSNIHTSIGISMLSPRVETPSQILHQAEEASAEASSQATSYVLYARADEPQPDTTRVLYVDPNWHGLPVD
jgi:PAS domain S-box-containing protein/diguanylate cyclase (GGDEF)-like protein